MIAHLVPRPRHRPAQREMLERLILIALQAALITGPGGGPRDEASLRNKFPRAFAHLPAGSHGLLVEKSTQSLILYKGSDQGLPELVRILPANTGQADGDKRLEGDLRTPEGIYFFTRTIEERQLPAEYGLRAFVTDFPNIYDRLAGKNGSNIWLHATDAPERVTDGYNTRGCVVVTNEHIDALTPLIRTGIRTDATPMVVEHELALLEPGGARSFNEELRLLVKEWEEAWESLDVDRYMDFYSRDLLSNGRDWQQQRDYKGRLARQYAFIEVALSELHVYTHDGEMVAAFRQHYRSDRYEAYANKRLYLRLEEGGWKIVRETSLLAR